MSVTGAFGNASEEHEEHRLGKAKNLKDPHVEQSHVEELERKYRDAQVQKKHEERTAQTLEEKRKAWEQNQIAQGKELPAWYVKKHGQPQHN